MAFNDKTRRKIIALPVQSLGSGTQISFDLPRVGMLARVWLCIRGTINTVTGAPNALGQSAVLARVRLQANNGQDIFNVTGPGYNYLLRPYLDAMNDPNPQNTGRTAIASAAPVNLDMVIPVAVNLRDAVGLIMLQNEQTLLSLKIDAAADSTLAATSTTWTTRCTVQPYIEVFMVPQDPRDWPALNVVHSVIEESTAIAAAGDTTYYWPRGNTYMQMIHGLGFGVAGADGFSRAKLRINQSDNLQDTATDFLDIQNPVLRAQARLGGVLPIDLVSTSGLGVYDLLRDTIDSRWVTDLATVVTATGAGTLYSLRRQLVPLN